MFAAVAGADFVDGLSRPSGNITGFMNFEYGFSGKWLELLCSTFRDRGNRGKEIVAHRLPPRDLNKGAPPRPLAETGAPTTPTRAKESIGARTGYAGAALEQTSRRYSWTPREAYESDSAQF